MYSMGRFKIGDIVCHKININDFYEILYDRLDGTYKVIQLPYENVTPMNIKIFIGEYLITKKERREYAINQIINS
jgi:hypothetical protein